MDRVWQSWSHSPLKRHLFIHLLDLAREEVLLTLLHPSFQNYENLRVLQICTTFVCWLFRVFTSNPISSPDIYFTTNKQSRYYLRHSHSDITSCYCSCALVALDTRWFSPVLPKLDLMKFFWAIESNLHTFTHKNMNSQAWFAR